MSSFVNTSDYEWLSKLAKGIAARFSIDSDEAQQDAYFGWLKAKEKHTGSNGASFRTYAAKKIRFAILDGWRDRSWQRRYKTKITMHGEDELPEVEIDHQFCTGIEKELALLDGIEREVVRLTCQYDKNNRQIAEILDITPARVILARERAIDKLRAVNG